MILRMEKAAAKKVPFRGLGVLAGIILTSTFINAQTIDISKDWKFEFGDKAEWAQLKTDDSQWKGMPKLGYIENLGYPDFKGFAWFRKKIVIPSSMKANAEKYGYAEVILGGIDDSDQGFFNGKMIGESGKLPPEPYVQGFYEFRIYRIDIKDILWDKENIIAVRLYDDVGDGGFYKGPYMFSIPEGESYKVIDKTPAAVALPENKQAWSKKIVIPVSLKAQAEKMNGLKLQTNLPGAVSFFLNDKLIDESVKARNHTIFIPYKVVDWGKENVLTVYVDKNAPKDEILFSKLKFADALWTDGVTVKALNAPKNALIEAGKPLEYTMEISNLSNSDFRGSISLELVSDIYNTEVSIHKSLELSKGSSKKTDFKFEPAFAGVYKVNYKILDSNGNIIMGQLSAGIIK